MEKSISFLLNGEKRTVEGSPSEGLLGMLRDKIGVKSPKCGCDRGDCGTCSVMIDGRVVRSCLVLAIEVDGAALTTLEGLLENGDLNPLQKAFLNKNAFQCGFCAPGMIMSATELLKRNSQPTRDEIKEGLAGNLCRCTGYTPIIDAVLDLVSEQKKDRKQ